MRLIDANALLKKCIEGDGDNKFTEGYNFAVQEITAYIALAPTVEAEPVRHGRWEYRHADDWMFCTACGADAEGNNYEPLETDYCPHCGARMDGGNNVLD